MRRLVVLLVAAVVLLSGVLAFGGGRLRQHHHVQRSELLGRPTNNSITINIVPAASIEYYYEYGTPSGDRTPGETATVTATGGQPHESRHQRPSANTKYYYRMVYDGTVSRRRRLSRPRQRAFLLDPTRPGAGFTFDVTSDSHVNIMLGSAAPGRRP